jgi:flagellar basal body-associated protein FliL
LCGMREGFTRKTIICLFVALTLMSLGLALVPSVFSQTETQNVKIVSYSCYIDNIGILDAVGEVQNVGSNTVTRVIIAGTVYSSDGTDQADSYATIGIEQHPVIYLSPGQKAPFYMNFYQPRNSPDETWYSADVSKVVLSVAQANATSSYEYPDLKITSSSGSVSSSTSDNGVYWVNGVIQNTGSQTAQNITVLGTFYNSTGNVVAVGYSNTVNTIASSGSSSFRLAAFDLNQTRMPTSEKISSYALLIETSAPILQGTAPVTTPTSTNTNPTSNPTGSLSSSTSPSTPVGTNNSTNPLNPTLIAIIVAIAIVVAAVGAVVALRKQKPGKQGTKETKKQALKKEIKKRK